MLISLIFFNMIFYGFFCIYDSMHIYHLFLTDVYIVIIALIIIALIINATLICSYTIVYNCTFVFLPSHKINAGPAGV